MKTAMQDFIDEVEDIMMVKGQLWWHERKKKALKKEKEQIIDAYEAAIERPIENYAEAYYNMNYKQDI